MADRNDPAHAAGYKLGYMLVGPALMLLTSVGFFACAAIGFGYLVGAW